MTVTVIYALTGSRTYYGMTQAEANRLINQIDALNQEMPTAVKVTVRD